ncbi:MAG: hypothetical protein LBE04_05750 [Prevotellaceae bacterium]|jgi:hypothetical protein|nr:hypothetical protein [Prevotellaceae bacterium]
MADSDYSMYKYYKGRDEYTNKKAKFFGFYESAFERTYKGKPEDKKEAFKDYMSHLLYEQASEIYMFGLPQVNKSEKYGEYLKEYFTPDLHLEYYERN